MSAFRLSSLKVPTLIIMASLVGACGVKNTFPSSYRSTNCNMVFEAFGDQVIVDVQGTATFTADIWPYQNISNSYELYIDRVEVSQRVFYSVECSDPVAELSESFQLESGEAF